MLGWSPRTWVLGGFAISFSSIVINTFVLANLNSRLAVINSEHSNLKDSLGRLATDYHRAETKYELVRVFHWVAMGVAEGEQRDQARAEVSWQLANYLTRTYAAVNDISPVELIKTEMVEKEDDFEFDRQLKELSDKRLAAQEAKNSKEEARWLAEINKMAEIEPQVYIPKTPLGKKFAELAKVAEVETISPNELDLVVAIGPTMQSLRQDFIRTFDTKTKRMEELNAQKSRLQGYQQLATYLAIGLQLLGLSFILSRDGVKDINDTKKKKAEELAKEQALEAAS